MAIKGFKVFFFLLIFVWASTLASQLFILHGPYQLFPRLDYFHEKLKCNVGPKALVVLESEVMVHRYVITAASGIIFVTKFISFTR